MSLDARFRDVTLPPARALGFSPGALADGERLAHKGRVLDLSPTDDGGVTARVRGAGAAPYEVTAGGESPGDFASSCTCPFGELCQHVAAVLFATEAVTAGWRGRSAPLGGRPFGLGKRPFGSTPPDDDGVEEEPVARPRRAAVTPKIPERAWMPAVPVAPSRPAASPPPPPSVEPVPAPPPEWPSVLGEPVANETPLRLGFRVTPIGRGSGERVTVELVRWSERGVARLNELPETDDLQSRAIALLLAAGTDAALGAALDLLADHPHVFVGARRARVLRQAITVQLVAERDAADEAATPMGLSLALALGNEVFAAGELPGRLIGGVVVRVEAGEPEAEATPLVLIAPVRTAAETLLSRLAAAPPVAPAFVLPRLVETLRGVGLEPSVEARLAPRRPCSRTVTVVRLEWRRPALDLTLGHVLHPDYPMLAPGEGPPILYVRDDLVEVAPERGTIRVVALERDLAGERETARDVEGRLGLRTGPGFRLRTSGDEALALMKRLRARGADDGVRFEWATGKPAFAEVTHKDLQIGGGEGAGSTRWLFLGGRVKHDGGSIPLDLLLRAIADRQRFVAVDGDSPSWLELEDGLRAQLAALAALTGVDGGLSPLAAPLLLDLEAQGATIADTVARAGLERVRAPGVVPEGLLATLRPYQDEGIRWLTQLSGWAPGAVLADDMGLGKTLQSIALLLHRRELGPALVVAPTSVTFNWLREIPRFAPTLTPRSFRAWRDGGGAVVPGLVVVIGWESMAIHAALLDEQRWSTIVFDEAQALKNQATRRTQAARALTAGFKLALTGTPVENRLSELWSLMDVVLPGLLDGHRERGESGPDALSALARAIRPFVLRRLKRDVAKDLPPRTDVVIDIELSEPERAEYDRIRGAAIAQVTARVKERDDDDDDGAERRAQAMVLSALLRLRQAACHPRLLDPESTTASAKLEALEGLVTTLSAAGHRALVFSQFASLLRLVRDHLEGLGFNIRHLDGSTPLAERRRQVDAFQAGDGDVFLISLQAGGTGLNLTAADYVVHLD
ncbi:MAG: SWIM zinc finger family protein, partial [Myxococcales bacterium]|nr:SWIM zinc finger family protein [Myxococcales bacterium]